ncbi:hypothetical protein TNCV_3940381 [Trichonephila clavipes]|uniref:Uncharacterized protein n=1 Tax=Trichonephila clavipes TaxID=2585209 RepID=A0A8X7BA30_TRICX|nr:hypothetical protein TNCV_3940381 [Trichonephila clavipes]
MSHQEKKRKHINLPTLKCPKSGEKTETHQFSPILERCHPLESFNSKCPIRRKNGNTSILSILKRCHPLESSTLNVPSGEKTETHQFSPILERCHPLESFNSKCPIRRKKRNTSILSNP